MDRVGIIVRGTVDYCIDKDVWDRIKVIAGRAAIFLLLLGIAFGLYWRIQHVRDHVALRFIEGVLLIAVWPVVAYSVTKAVGDGEFLGGLWKGSLATAIAGALIVVIVWLAMPEIFPSSMQMQDWTVELSVCQQIPLLPRRR